MIIKVYFVRMLMKLWGHESDHRGLKRAVESFTSPELSSDLKPLHGGTTAGRHSSLDSYH